MATVDFRYLKKQCPGKTAKGQENLSRIARGLYPRREGAPKAIREAAFLAQEEEAVQQAAARRELKAGGGACPAGSSGAAGAEGPGAASAVPSQAASLDPEEEAAAWLF